LSTRIVLSAHDMSYSDVKPVLEPTERIVPKLGRGELDAAFSANPVMFNAAREVNQTVPLRLLPIQPDRDQPPARELRISQAGDRGRQSAA
jgi:TRAP-type uncharacterized transport system substrate-binding protein